MKGFTLIELSVALSIMAMLAAVLLPRMAQLQRTARIGNLKGLHGAVAVAATLVHAKLVARSGLRDTVACAGGGIADNQAVGPGTVCTEAGLVHTWHGYPASKPLGTPGIASAVGLTSTFAPTDAQLQAQGYRVTVNGAVTTFARADADRAEHCSFTYTQATDAKTAAVVSDPAVSGC
jgi:MSHA pilin protein MshA